MKATSYAKLAWGLLPLLFSLAAVQAPAQQMKSFKWSLALLDIKSSEMIPFSDPIRSSTGERYQIIIKPEERAFCYIIYISPDGEDMAVLCSGGPLKGGEPWYSDILELAAPEGSESLYIITSLNEQKDLLQKIDDLKKNNGPRQRRALVNEINNIRSNVSKFREIPEKPVLMGGATRGSTSERNGGTEFSGLDTYVKIISIDH
jgi:hypothetical protein